MSDTLTAAAGLTVEGTHPDEPLLAVSDLCVDYPVRRGLLRAVNGISYDLFEGETLAILGESGCGKSAGAQAVAGAFDPNLGVRVAGSVRFRGRELLTLTARQRRALRGPEIAMVYQSASLNPTFSVGWQIGEMLRVHESLSRRACEKRIVGVLERVGIPSPRQRMGYYPHQLSGGLRQRVSIAMAIVLNPAVVIADEPTSALDVTVQAQILDLLRDLQAETQMGLILITHDLGVAAEMANRVAVMYAGEILETGPMAATFREPRHPYTLGLLRSRPEKQTRGGRLVAMPGLPPDPTIQRAGCAFEPRCPYARRRCGIEPPPLVAVAPHRSSACFFHGEVGQRKDEA